MPDSAKPDFAAGVPLRLIPDGAMLAGTVGDDEVVLIRRGEEVFAVGAYCTHYHGPLAQGLLVGETVRCLRAFDVRSSTLNVRSSALKALNAEPSIALL